MGTPWDNQCLRRVIFSPAFMALGALFALEGLRRNYIGGLGLGLFIDIGSSPHESCERDTTFLRAYLDMDKTIIDNVPHFAWPLIGPWIDHHNASETFYDIAMLLCYQKKGLENMPTSCIVHWQQ